MKTIKVELDDAQQQRFDGYRTRVLEHRKTDPKYLDPSYAEGEAASVLVGYGLDFVEGMDPSDEELIGVPPGCQIVAVGAPAKK